MLIFLLKFQIELECVTRVTVVNCDAISPVLPLLFEMLLFHALNSDYSTKNCSFQVGLLFIIHL